MHKKLLTTGLNLCPGTQGELTTFPASLLITGHFATGTDGIKERAWKGEERRSHLPLYHHFLDPPLPLYHVMMSLVYRSVYCGNVMSLSAAVAQLV